MRLALRASAEANLQQQYPQHNELAVRVFGVDTVNQTEEFTAIVRQMQKHALLFADASAGVRVGDWRPSFLSDWVRGALLLRAWRERQELEPEIPAQLLRSTIARAQGANTLYGALLPELIEEVGLQEWQELVEAVACESASSPDACGNYWRLRARLPDGMLVGIPEPQSIPELTDLSSVSFQSLSLRRPFSSNLAVFVASEVSGCSLEGITATSSDFTEVTFINSTFCDVKLSYCDGPMAFDSCAFSDCSFVNMKSRSAPALVFSDCRFSGAIHMQQESPVVDGHTADPVAVFTRCEMENGGTLNIGGDWCGYVRGEVPGVVVRGSRDGVPPAVSLLRTVLNYFFPRGAGESGRRQARSYIRISAIGRGVWPEGSPREGDVIAMLRSVGFADGGRGDHIYAPWSSLVKARGGTDIREECIAFVLRDERGSFVNDLLQRIDQAATWPESSP